MPPSLPTNNEPENKDSIYVPITLETKKEEENKLQGTGNMQLGASEGSVLPGMAGSPEKS